MGTPEDSSEEPLDLSDLEGKTVEEILREGQKALFIQLVGKCRAGLANHQEMSILRNLLKDNGLTLGLPPADGAAEDDQRHKPAPVDLPDFDKPGYMN